MRKGWAVLVLVLVPVVVLAACGEKSDEAAAEEVLLDRPVGEWLADLKKGDADARAYAAEVLRGADASPLVVRELLAALDDENVKVRQQVGRALQRIAYAHEEAAVALARAIRDDPGGAGDMFWMRGCDEPVESPVAVGILVEILFDPNVSWPTLEKASKMLHSADREVALAAVPADLSTEQHEALVLLIQKGPAFRLVRAVECFVGDHVRARSEMISRSSDGALDAECAEAPWSRKRDNDRRIPARHYAAPTGSSPRITVTAVEAETGEPVTVSAVFLQDGSTGNLSRPISGGTLSSIAPPAAGDVLFVYARGHEPARVTLTGEEETLAVRLEKAKGSFTVGPVQPREDLADVRVQAFIGLSHPVDGKTQELNVDTIDVPIGKNGIGTAALPESFRAIVFIRTVGDALIWPPCVRAAPGARIPIHLERPRRTEIIVPGPGYFGEPALARDLTADPGWPRYKVDALTAWQSRHEPIFVAGEKRLYLDAPDIGWHLFARWEGRRLYLRIPTGSAEVMLPLEPEKKVGGRPVVDGEPVPDMTILAPGRLDLDSIRGIGVRGHRVEGYAHAVHSASRWLNLTLPHSDWLTAWHPEKGTAWLEWKEGETPSGEWLPGRIEIRGDPGERMTGTARINPVWPGAGTVRTGSDFEPLERSFESVEEIVFPGLAFGTYHVHLDVTIESEGKEPRKARKSIAEKLDESHVSHSHKPD